MPARPTSRWTSAHLALASILLGACASGPSYSPSSARGDLRLDTESVARIRYAAVAAESTSPLAATATRTVASRLAHAVPLLLTLLKSDNEVSRLEERLEECARLAERRVNSSYFGNRPPTRHECGEELVVDGCPTPITRAMLLGREKHVLALQCAREVLEELWPAPFSIEQRYRYYQHAQVLETVSKAEEARLIQQGCTRELWRTIKPDIVLHADRNLLRSILTLDFKFPCPDTNKPRWTEYGDKSAYTGYNQGDIYRQALGGEAYLISPKGVVIQ
jgi:hypothetical protein